MPWSVQATWTVGDEQKTYAPQFARTRIGARRLKRDMERTLAHFPTLQVIVEKVPAQAAIESSRVAATEPVHLIHDPVAATTACGRPTSDVAAVAVRDVFELSRTPCERCQLAAEN